MNKKALIAMSGGVDSSVAAHLMLEQGFECSGVMMKLIANEQFEPIKEQTNTVLGHESCHDKGCCTLDNATDARSVAHQLGIPFYVFNYTDRFNEQVISRFIDAYRHGKTPNPCIDCNKYLKFGALLQRAFELEHDYIVTGHYAQIEHNDCNRFDDSKRSKCDKQGRLGDALAEHSEGAEHSNISVCDESSNRNNHVATNSSNTYNSRAYSRRFLLKKGVDPDKDQSYVLYTMTQEQLAHTLFPIGGLRKTDVRSIAEAQGFINKHKRESQDICFVPDGDYASFISRRSGYTFPKGNIVDLNGKVLGTHNGIIHYTIGQRRGLGISSSAGCYVHAINTDTNEIVVGDDSTLYSDTLFATDINLIAYENLDAPLRAAAKIRYRHTAQPAMVTQLDDDTLKVVFDAPQRAITKGQAVVIYDGDVVVGGGTIV